MIKRWMGSLVLGAALLLGVSVVAAQETEMPEPIAMGAFESAALDVALNTDGTLAYVAHADGTLAVYTVGEEGSFTLVGEPVAANGISFQPVALALSPDGRMLYVANSGFIGRSLLSPITLWSVDPNTGALSEAGRQSVISNGTGLTGIAVSANGTRLMVSGARDGGIALFSLDAAGPQVVTMVVSPFKLPCTGVGPMLCHWVSINGGAEQFFYGGIEGFTFEWGHTYELRVQVDQVPNPPADGSSLRYTLVEVVSDSGFQPGATFFAEVPAVLVTPNEDGTFSLNGEINFTCAEETQCSALARFLEGGISTVIAEFSFAAEGEPLVANVTLPQN